MAVFCMNRCRTPIPFDAIDSIPIPSYPSQTLILLLGSPILSHAQGLTENGILGANYIINIDKKI